jgi:hypothetical protein
MDFYSLGMLLAYMLVMGDWVTLVNIMQAVPRAEDVHAYVHDPLLAVRGILLSRPGVSLQLVDLMVWLMQPHGYFRPSYTDLQLILSQLGATAGSGP